MALSAANATGMLVWNHCTTCWNTGSTFAHTSMMVVRIPPQSPAQAAARSATAATMSVIGLAIAAMAVVIEMIPEAMVAAASRAPMAISAALNSSECWLTNSATLSTNGFRPSTSPWMPGTSVPVIHVAAVCTHAVNCGPCSARNPVNHVSSSVSTGNKPTPTLSFRFCSCTWNPALCCAAEPITSGILAVLAASFSMTTFIMPACCCSLVNSSVLTPYISEARAIASSRLTWMPRLSRIMGDRRPTPLTIESIIKPMSWPVAADTFDR